MAKEDFEELGKMQNELLECSSNILELINKLNEYKIQEKSVEEMFNEVGYILEVENDIIIAKRKNEDYHIDEIYFRLDDKIIEFGEDCVVDMKMLEAVNKLCEELEWL